MHGSGSGNIYITKYFWNYGYRDGMRRKFQVLYLDDNFWAFYIQHQLLSKEKIPKGIKMSKIPPTSITVF